MNPNLLKAIATSRDGKSSLASLAPKAAEKNYRKKTNKILEDFFYRALNKLKIDVLLECGAHEASASKKARSLGLSAIAIEANPLTFHSMTKQSETVGVDVLNVGLGAHISTLPFYVPISNQEAGSATFQKKIGVTYKTIMINVTTIDNIVKEKSIDDRCLALWIDVEGFSRDVLLGAKYVLESQQCPLINIEVESNPYFSGQALATEINDVLSGFGLVPVLTDCESVDQFNVVYIREELLDKVSEDLRNSWIDLSRIKFSFFDWIYFAFIYKLKERLLTLLKGGAIRLFGNEVGHKMAAKFGSKKSSIVVTQTESDRSVGNSP